MQSLSIVPRCALLCLSARLGCSGRAIAPLHSQGQRAHQVRLRDHAHQAIVCIHDGDVVVAPLGKQRHQIHGVLLHTGHLHGVGHDLTHALRLAAAPHDQGPQALARELAGRGEQGSIATLICDAGERYDDTLFTPGWVAAQGLDAAATIADSQAT